MNLPSTLLELFSSLNVAGVPSRSDPGHVLSPRLDPPLDKWLADILREDEPVREPIASTSTLTDVKLSLPQQITGELLGTFKAAEFAAAAGNLSAAGLAVDEQAPPLPYFVPVGALTALGAGAGVSGLVTKLTSTLNVVGDPLRNITGRLTGNVLRTLLPGGYRIRMSLKIVDGKGEEVSDDQWLIEDLDIADVDLKLPRLVPLPRFYEPAPLAPTLDRYYISVTIGLYAPGPLIGEVAPGLPETTGSAAEGAIPGLETSTLTPSGSTKAKGKKPAPKMGPPPLLGRTIGPIPVDVPRIPLPTILILSEDASLDGRLVVLVPRASMLNCPFAFGDLVEPIKDVVATARAAALVLGVALGKYDALVDYIDRARAAMSQIDVAFARRDVVDLHDLDKDEGILDDDGGFPKDILSSILLIGPPTRKVAFYVSRAGKHSDGWFTLETGGNFVGYISSLKKNNTDLGEIGGVDVRDNVAKRPRGGDNDQWFNDNLSLVRFYPL